MKVNSEVLYESINDGSIKAGTKLKVYKDDVYVTTITFDGYDFIWETGTFSSGMLFNPLVDFEEIEEQKDIEEIKMIGCNMEIDLFDKKTLLPTENMQTEFIISKINELVREVRKLKNK